MTDPKPLTYDEQKAAEGAFKVPFMGIRLMLIGPTPPSKFYARLCAAIATQRTIALNPPSKWNLEEVGR